MLILLWSWAKTLPNRLKDLIKKASRELFLPILLFLEIGIFWQVHAFGSAFANSLIAFTLLAVSLFFYIKNRKLSIEPLTTLSLFLGFTILFYLHFALLLPLWISEILIFFLALFLFIYLCYEEGRLENSMLFSLALLICVLEAFFILSFWPVNPLAKSFILTSIFYLFWHVVIKEEKPLNYLILTATVLLLVIVTTRWPII